MADLPAFLVDHEKKRRPHRIAGVGGSLGQGLDDALDLLLARDVLGEEDDTGRFPFADERE